MASLDDALRAAVREEVTTALDEALAHLKPANVAPAPLLDRAGLAAALGVSIPHVDKLKRRPGFPVVHVGDAPRFDLADVRRYLREAQ
jgi:hypothetical protein